LWFNLTLPLLRNYPLVVSIHDPRPHLGDKGAKKTPQVIINLGYRSADQVIAHNNQMKQILVKELNIPEGRIQIIPLVERGNPTLTADVREIENYILYFGRIWEYKGLEYLIRAEPLITAQIPEAKIVIAGRGDDFTRYKRMMANPENFIVYNEFVSYEKRAELFERASMVVLPYIEATQSGVIPVAYAHAKPVIATSVGGLPSQVEDGKTGFLVPPRDEKMLAEKIVFLIENRELRHTLGLNGRHKLNREWSAAVVARRTIPVYESAIQTAR
jgi:glycosyltransferase involved in cell wall biosynthesis